MGSVARTELLAAFATAELDLLFALSQAGDSRSRQDATLASLAKAVQIRNTTAVVGGSAGKASPAADLDASEDLGQSLVSSDCHSHDSGNSSNERLHVGELEDLEVELVRLTFERVRTRREHKKKFERRSRWAGSFIPSAVLGSAAS